MSDDFNYEITPLQFGIAALAAGAIFAGLYYAETEGYTDFIPESVDNDVPGTATIEDEGYSFRRRFRPGHYWFVTTVEGEHERFWVSRDAADKYNPGDTVDITYDRSHWRDGSTSVSGVHLK